MPGYPTPEEAARSTAPDNWRPPSVFPSVEEWAFVVGSSIAPDGGRALVILGEDREVGAYWGQESWCQREDDGWHINEWCRYGGAPLVHTRGVGFAAWGHPYAEDELVADWYSHLMPAPTIIGFE